MIPGSSERLKALKEIFRVLKPGGRFVFTGHDRDLSNQKDHWSEEVQDWQAGTQDGRKSDFGDVIENTELGTMFIHSTCKDEVDQLLNSVGFHSIETWLRRELGKEGPAVRQFSDECRFWKAVKPVE